METKSDEGLSQSREDLLKTNVYLREQVEALFTLQNIATGLSLERHSGRLLERIVASATELLKASGGSLLMVDEATGELVFEVVRGEKSERLLHRRLKPGEGIAGWVAARGSPLIANDVAQDSRFYRGIDEVTHLQTASIICVPLRVRGKIIGVLEVVNKLSGEGFNSKDQSWLSTLASQAAIAIDNARLYERLEAEKRRILNYQEDLRRRLAQKLHDGPAQSLANLGVMINLIRKLMDGEPSRAARELGGLEVLARQTDQEIRTVLFELRPLVLETAGLGGVLRECADRLRAECYTVELSLDDGADRYDPLVEAMVFSIVQEALNNVRQHAQARTVGLAMSKRSNSLVVSVRDDGVGFDLAAVEGARREGQRLGTVNMRQQAQLIDGRLDLRSAPGQGTVVTVLVPLATARMSATQ